MCFPISKLSRKSKQNMDIPTAKSFKLNFNGRDSKVSDLIQEINEQNEDELSKQTMISKRGSICGLISDDCESVLSDEYQQKLSLINITLNNTRIDFDNITISNEETNSKWIITDEMKSKYDKIFNELCIQGSLLSENQVFSYMKSEDIQSQTVMEQIWILCNITKTKWLDDEEFALCAYLTNKYKTDNIVPEYLTKELVPPSKEQLLL